MRYRSTSNVHANLIEALKQLEPAYRAMEAQDPVNEAIYASLKTEEKRRRSLEYWNSLRITTEYSQVATTLYDYMPYVLNRNAKVVAYLVAFGEDRKDIAHDCLEYILRKLPDIYRGTQDKCVTKMGETDKYTGWQKYIGRTTTNYLISKARMYDPNYGRSKNPNECRALKNPDLHRAHSLDALIDSETGYILYDVIASQYPTPEQHLLSKAIREIILETFLDACALLSRKQEDAFMLELWMYECIENEKVPYVTLQHMIETVGIDKLYRAIHKHNLRSLGASVHETHAFREYHASTYTTPHLTQAKHRAAKLFTRLLQEKM